MKQRVKKFMKQVCPALWGVVTMAVMQSSTCFAANAAASTGGGTGGSTGGGTGGSTSTITQPLDNLKTLMIAVIGAIGVIILAKNVMEFAQAYQQQDSATMNSALKGIVAGVMMAGISAVLAFLGF